MDLNQALAYPKYKKLVEQAQELRESLQASIKCYQESANDPNHPIYQNQKKETVKLRRKLLSDFLLEWKLINNIKKIVSQNDKIRLGFLRKSEEYRKKRPLSKKLCENSYLQGYYFGRGETHRTENVHEENKRDREALELLDKDFDDIRSKTERLPLSQKEKDAILKFEKENGIVTIDSKGNIQL